MQDKHLRSRPGLAMLAEGYKDAQAKGTMAQYEKQTGYSRNTMRKWLSGNGPERRVPKAVQDVLTRRHVEKQVLGGGREKATRNLRQDIDKVTERLRHETKESQAPVNIKVTLADGKHMEIHYFQGEKVLAGGYHRGNYRTLDMAQQRAQELLDGPKGKGGGVPATAIAIKQVRMENGDMAYVVYTLLKSSPVSSKSDDDDEEHDDDDDDDGSDDDDDESDDEYDGGDE